jgi:hypothetical protein
MQLQNPTEIGIGSLAEWVSALLTAGLLLWTLLAWRRERRHARELEAREEKRRRRQTASQVSAWVQRITPVLQESAALPSNHDFGIGNWVLCIANKTSFGLYDWRVSGVVGPPEIAVNEGDETHGPIGPDGLVVVSLPAVDPAASPVVELTLTYRDEGGDLWTRSNSGLLEVSDGLAAGAGRD